MSDKLRDIKIESDVPLPQEIRVRWLVDNVLRRMEPDQSFTYDDLDEPIVEEAIELTRIWRWESQFYWSEAKRRVWRL